MRLGMTHTYFIESCNHVNVKVIYVNLTFLCRHAVSNAQSPFLAQSSLIITINMPPHIIILLFLNPSNATHVHVVPTNFNALDDKLTRVSNGLPV